MTKQLTDIGQLRKDLELNQEQFAEKLGLKGKASVSEIERTRACSVGVALRIEELSEGRIDAATLNGEVAAARAQSPDAFRAQAAA